MPSNFPQQNNSENRSDRALIDLEYLPVLVWLAVDAARRLWKTRAADGFRAVKTVPPVR